MLPFQQNKTWYNLGTLENFFAVQAPFDGWDRKLRPNEPRINNPPTWSQTIATSNCLRVGGAQGCAGFLSSYLKLIFQFTNKHTLVSETIRTLLQIKRQF